MFVFSMAIGMLLMFLSGCSQQPFTLDHLTKMPRKVPGTSDSELINLERKLIHHGVTVISIGDDYLVSIPSSMLFPDQSPQLTWNSYATLNDVVIFLKQFRKITVHVTSYSVPYRAVKREKALTLARAKTVANYLWSQGIDSRLILSEGNGSTKPIMVLQRGGDQSINSRIEITFRDTVI